MIEIQCLRCWAVNLLRCDDNPDDEWGVWPCRICTTVYARFVRALTFA